AEAWTSCAGGSEPIAVVDTGVAYNHEDLVANIWSNSAEAGGVGGVDDDPYLGTGSDGIAGATPRSYVDDVRGWDFIGHLDDNGTPELPLDDLWIPDNDPADEDGHGTHVAGIAAGAGNLAGVVGVNPQAKIMPLRAGDANGLFPFGAIEEAFSYAVDHGARVVNASFGGTTSSPGMEAIITANPQTLFVVAAGNHGTNHELGGSSRIYPCDITAPNIICVAASDYNDGLASFSDYGHPSVDIAAPGKAILSTIPDQIDPAAGGVDDYDYFDGTSMASPYVAGAASLIWSAYPTLESSQVKTLLVTNVDAKNTLAGKIGFGGRLNANTSLLAAANPPPPGWPATPDPPPGDSGNPPVDNPPSDGTTPAPEIPSVLDTVPPVLHVVSPRKQRDGWSGIVRLEVICGERCTIAVRARPNVRGAKALKRSYKSDAGQSRTIKLRFKGDTLRRVRAALEQRRRVGVFVSVKVSDASGNRAAPKAFRVSLLR
ncbi:MAG: S8 family serine peptidase, partial [Actinobacteria bacterium]|nr:S8 family serine peptidase [Actinomycetota bacterium]